MHSQYAFTELSFEPALPTMSYYAKALHPFTYRHPLEAGQDEARILRYDFPNVPLGAATPSYHELLTSKLTLCKYMLGGVLGEVNKTDSNLAKVKVRGDTLSKVPEIGMFAWDDKDVRTESFAMDINDSISFIRRFRLGKGEPGDTAEAISQLSGPTDYIKMKINLRRASNDQLLFTLDSAVLSYSGYTQSTTGIDDTIRSFISTIIDTVYLNIEASRGVDTNGIELSHNQYWGTYYFDSPLPPPPAPKIAGQPASRPMPAARYDMNVSIVPNPFTSSTTISFSTLKDVPLTVTIYDAGGRQIQPLYSGMSDREKYMFTINNTYLETGMYYVRIQSGSTVETHKIQLVK